jgi:O-antigen ligase
MIRIQYILLYVFSFTLVFENWEMMSFGGNSLPKLFAIMFMGLTMFSSRKTFDYNMLKRYLNPLFIFSLILLFPYVYNFSELSSSFTGLSTILLNVLFFWFIGNLVVRKPILAYRMIQVFVFGVFLSSILFLLNIGIEYEDGRMALFGENQNKIGIFCAFAVLYIMTTLIENYRGYKLRRYFLLLFLLPLINMIAETGSRVTFISLMLSLMVFILLRRSGNSIKKVLFIVVGAAILFFLFNYFMTFDVLRERMLSTYEDQDLAGRDRIWENLWPLFKKSPAVGIGIGGYADFANSYYGAVRSPHNVFIEILVYSGLAGFISFFTFIYFIFKDSLKIFLQQHFVFPLLLILFLFLVFFTGQALNVKSFWMIYLYIVSVRYNTDFIREKEEVQNLTIIETETV